MDSLRDLPEVGPPVGGGARSGKAWGSVPLFSGSGWGVVRWVGVGCGGGWGAGWDPSETSASSQGPTCLFSEGTCCRGNGLVPPEPGEGEPRCAAHLSVRT